MGGRAAGRDARRARASHRREIVLRDLDRRLVDFPAIRDGREVYRWIGGEQDIEFWHELDAGYASRQEL